MEKRIHTDPADLLLRFSQGDEAAFAVVYDQFYARVYGFAKRWLNEQKDAEDLTADTFVKLWNKRETFQSIDNIGAFLYITVRNGCFNFLRHGQIKRQKEIKIRRNIEESNEADFVNQEVRAEFLRLVYAEVEKMPAKMKQVFELSYKEGLKPSEIAQQLSLSVQTVKNHKVNAIKLLRLAINENTLALALVLLLEMPSGDLKSWYV